MKRRLKEWLWQPYILVWDDPTRRFPIEDFEIEGRDGTWLATGDVTISQGYPDGSSWYDVDFEGDLEFKHKDTGKIIDRDYDERVKDGRWNSLADVLVDELRSRRRTEEVKEFARRKNPNWIYDGNHPSIEGYFVEGCVNLDLNIPEDEKSSWDSSSRDRILYGTLRDRGHVSDDVIEALERDEENDTDLDESVQNNNRNNYHFKHLKEANLLRDFLHSLDKNNRSIIPKYIHDRVLD